MLPGDFKLLRKAEFWQSLTDRWLDPTLGRPQGIRVCPQADSGLWAHLCAWGREQGFQPPMADVTGSRTNMIGTPIVRPA